MNTSLVGSRKRRRGCYVLRIVQLFMIQTIVSTDPSIAESLVPMQLMVHGHVFKSLYGTYLQLCHSSPSGRVCQVRMTCMPPGRCVSSKDVT